MSVKAPEYPASSSAHWGKEGGPYESELEEALKVYDDAVASDDWIDGGFKDEVKLERLEIAGDPLPIVRGTCTVEGITVDELFPLVQLPGVRKVWDEKMEAAWPMARYTRTSYAFYTVMHGLGWLVSPRDFSGAARTIRKDDGSQVQIIQTSVENDDAPTVSGKVRGKLFVSAWKLTQKSADVELEYVTKVSLEGSIPYAILNSLATDIPMCTGKVRNLYYEHGFVPYLKPDFGTAIKIEREESEPLVKKWKFIGTSIGKDHIEIAYDTKRMYADGVQVSAENADVEDDGKGTIKVTLKAKDGEHFTVSVSAK